MLWWVTGCGIWHLPRWVALMIAALLSGVMFCCLEMLVWINVVERDVPMVRAAGFLDDRIFWFCRRCGSNNRYTVHLSCQQAGLWGHSQSVKIFFKRRSSSSASSTTRNLCWALISVYRFGGWGCWYLRQFVCTRLGCTTARGTWLLAASKSLVGAAKCGSGWWRYVGKAWLVCGFILSLPGPSVVLRVEGGSTLWDVRCKAAAGMHRLFAPR